MNKYFFTCGDPNGIGIEIVIKTLNKVFNTSAEFYFVCPKEQFLLNASIVKPKFKFEFYTKNDSYSVHNNHVKIIDIKGGRVSRGKPTKTSGKVSFASLEVAIDLISKSENSALITAPISKEAWKFNSVKFDGHTDYLGDVYNVVNPLMLFYSHKLIAALVTIHHPIKEVSSVITKAKLQSIFSSILNTLRNDFKIIHPKIAVLGLNPHAGENGVLGIEEINTIIPIVNKHKKNFFGPFVPDAFFGMHQYKNYDAVLGMYHDQVLIPFKMLSFEDGVNFTANLPIVRTSPDHGTAFDIAYKGVAEPQSMISAFRLAEKIVKNRGKK